MPKKHYQAIAAIIAEEWNRKREHVDYYGAQTALRHAAGKLAAYFATENPRFDRARFLAACGVDGAK